MKENKKEEGLNSFKEVEEFSVLDSTKWTISEKKLGNTSLMKDNVFIEDEKLGIKLPPGELSGGEIQSVNNFAYGNYEARMKLPDAGSSITGFFMYAPPDFFYEIDIELLNDPSGTLWLTTYAEGAVSNATEYDLGFDPTKEFHDYGFEYAEGKVTFYVDDKPIHTFNGNIPDGTMKLMVNCWYPDWRGMEPVQEEQELLVEWIKY